MRSVLFCNEMLGLGHLSLSLALADALVSSDEAATALVVTGSPAAGSLPSPPRVDLLKLPTAPVGSDSSWGATGRRAAAGLAVEPSEVHALRAQLCLTAVVGVRPDLVVVDYRPLGRHRDLLPALEHLHRRGDCTVAFGMWEVDDAPQRLRGSWTPELTRAVGDLYDLALVYGRPEPGDVRVEALSAAGVPVHETGLVGRPPAADPPPDLGSGYLLATAGGGADGLELLDAVVAAIRARPLPVAAVVVTGPLMAPADVARLRERAEGLEVRVLASRPDMDAVLAGAAAVVAMAGYNTTAEALATGRPTLLVPRAFPREEQLNRARRLAAEGRVSMVHPDDLDPVTLREAIGDLLDRPPAARDGLTGAAQAARVLRRAAGVEP